MTVFQRSWCVVVAGLVVLACTTADTEVPPQSATAPAAAARQIERGRAVYAEQKCQACHSIGQVGNRRSPLDGVGDRISEDDIRKWIVSPREMNPRVTKRAFDKLPKSDLDALVAYLKQLRKK
jgi:cytochrome c2